MKKIQKYSGMKNGFFSLALAVLVLFFSIIIISISEEQIFGEITPIFGHGYTMESLITVVTILVLYFIGVTGVFYLKWRLIRFEKMTSKEFFQGHLIGLLGFITLMVVRGWSEYLSDLQAPEMLSMILGWLIVFGSIAGSMIGIDWLFLKYFKKVRT